MAAPGGTAAHGREARATRRFPLKLPVIVKSPDGTTDHEAQTRDVSARGVCFYIDGDHLEQGSDIEFMLTLPPEVTLTEAISVRCKGRIVRIEANHPGGKTAVAAQIEKYEFLGH